MKTLTLFILFLLPLLSSGQSFSQFITNDTILNIICQKLPNYDSLLLYSQSSYSPANPRLKGIGYQGVNRYLFCIEFSFPLTIENNKHPFFSKEIYKRNLPEVLSGDVRLNFNQDMLEVYKCGDGNIMLVSSCGTYSTLIMLYPKQMSHVYWQAYNAEMYQGPCPNSDRERFMIIFKALSKLMPITEVCEQEREFLLFR
jgi:hypothetical protein